jgi:uncharacterized membrane protein
MTTPKHSTPVSLLEQLTGLVLILVLAAIGYIVLATLLPNIPQLDGETEVIAVIGLLSAALALVSVVALLHTRK